MTEEREFNSHMRNPPNELECAAYVTENRKKIGMKLRFMFIKKSLRFHGGKFNSNL